MQSWPPVLAGDAGVVAPVPEPCHILEPMAMGACPLVSCTGCWHRSMEGGRNLSHAHSRLGALPLRWVLHPTVQALLGLWQRWPWGPPSTGCQDSGAVCRFPEPLLLCYGVSGSTCPRVHTAPLSPLSAAGTWTSTVPGLCPTPRRCGKSHASTAWEDPGQWSPPRPSPDCAPSSSHFQLPRDAGGWRQRAR